MPEPTLLTKGSLKIPADAENVTPISYIVAWIKKRMPEFGGRSAKIADRVLIVQSETGSGKSTVLPVHVFRILRSENTPRKQKYRGPSVLCTQPRVITAMDLAERQVGGAPHYPDMVLGQTVGYQTGPFSEKPPAGLLFATIGVLSVQLRTMQDSEIMDMYRFIIIDEAHERPKEADLTMMKLKYFMMRNEGSPRLPFLILASATINLTTFSDFFGVGKENTVHVVGRSYEITKHWPDRGTNNYPLEAARLAVMIHEEDEKTKKDSKDSKEDEKKELKDSRVLKDILIFMPGNEEIKSTREALEEKNAELVKAGIPPMLILTINRGAVEEKNAEFRLVTAATSRFPLIGEAMPSRRVIISTVVAETGLTIETLRHVIDCGWNRTREWYPPHGVSGLVTRPAPQSRIKQRMGRAGRVAPGDFWALYTENVYNTLDVQQFPEIVTGGMNDILLEIVREQCSFSFLEKSSQKQSSQKGEESKRFRVEDMMLLGSPPVDSLRAAIDMATAMGFLTDGASNLSPLGSIAAGFMRTPPDMARLIMASYTWKASMRDVIAIATMTEFTLESLMEKKILRENKNAVRDLVKESLPPFLPSTATQARLMISDDFIEHMMVLDLIMRRIEGSGGDFGRVVQWCTLVGLDASKMTKMLARREEIFEDVLVAGLDPFAHDDLRLSKADKDQFMPRIVALKRCIYDGCRTRLLRHAVEGTTSARKFSNEYVDRFGLKIKIPPLISERESMEIPYSKPTFVVTSAFEFEAKQPLHAGDPKPLLYSIKARKVSVMDGYVDVDVSFLDPAECDTDRGSLAPMTEKSPQQASKPEISPEIRLQAYNRICSALLSVSS